MTVIGFPARESNGSSTGAESRPAEAAPRQHRSGRRRGDLRLQTLAEWCLYYRQLIDALDAAVISLSCQGTVRAWNEAAERLFGYSEDEVRNRSIIFLSPPGAPDQPWRIGDVGGDVALHWRGQAVAQHKNHRPVPVQIASTPIRNEQGEYDGVVWLVRHPAADDFSGTAADQQHVVTRAPD